MPKNKRVAIYARVSTLDQNPQMQLQELRAYAKRRALNLVYEFVDHASGAKDQRPELTQLWRHVRDRKVDIGDTARNGKNRTVTKLCSSWSSSGSRRASPID